MRDNPEVNVYRGFGNEKSIIVIGHVLKRSPRPRKTFNSNWFRNFFSVIRLFMVSPVRNALVTLKWGDETFLTTTEKDGFFRFIFKPAYFPGPGWYDVKVSLVNNDLPGESLTCGYGSVFIPQQSQITFISDIDDTFLISHTSKLRRRLFSLLMRNERSRKAFDGVINHYQLLAQNNAENGPGTNPFFYVSSSEWNLYHFLLEFITFNDLPKGVLLLGQIKKLKDFWRSGQNNHSTKFMRIVRIIETYPNQKFVLLGDDSQQDPIIYQSIADHFPERIRAIYLRKIHEPNYGNVSEIVHEMENKGIEVCYFKHSAEAVIHSKKIGLIRR